MPRIRRFEERDLAPVVALWSGVFGYPQARNNPTDVIVEHARHAPEGLLVAEFDGRVVGTLMTGYDGHRGWFYRLAVDEPARRTGIATALVRAGEALLQDKGCKKINLQLHDDNLSGSEFWRAVGYAVEARISMGKDLTGEAPAGGDAGC